MSEVGNQLQALLNRGVEQHLFSGASAGISWPGGRELAWAGTHAVDDATPVDSDSLFDLASVSKTFTAAAALRLSEQGIVDLDRPVDELLEVGRGEGAEDITLRMLLTHVSGLPAESMTWKEPGVPVPDRLGRVLKSELEAPPGAAHVYSCVGYIAAGAVLEAATGSRLPELVDELVSRPLGLASVGYGPVPPESAVATEAQPWAGRSMLRGEVHDELNRYLGGTVGNAGLFANAADVLTFAESHLDDRLFAPGSLELMTTDQVGGGRGAPYGQALGSRVRDREFLGELDGFGHTGFTGTMWIALPAQGVSAVLLTNRVHPHRENVDLSAYRQQFSAWAAAVD